MSSYRDHDERSQHQQQHGNGRLPMSDIGAVNKRAQIQGSMMGVGGGIIAALVARRIAPQSSNIIVMSGLLTGTGVAYVASRANLHSGMRQLQEHKRAVRKGTDEMNDLDLHAGSQRDYEGGVAGMYDLRDPAHTTRGDH